MMSNEEMEEMRWRNRRRKLSFHHARPNRIPFVFLLILVGTFGQDYMETETGNPLDAGVPTLGPSLSPEPSLLPTPEEAESSVPSRTPSMIVSSASPSSGPTSAVSMNAAPPSPTLGEGSLQPGDFMMSGGATNETPNPTDAPVIAPSPSPTTLAMTQTPMPTPSPTAMTRGMPSDSPVAVTDAPTKKPVAVLMTDPPFAPVMSGQEGPPVEAPVAVTEPEPTPTAPPPTEEVTPAPVTPEPTAPPPTKAPTKSPTLAPTKSPTPEPTESPTPEPTTTPPTTKPPTVPPPTTKPPTTAPPTTKPPTTAPPTTKPPTTPPPTTKPPTTKPPTTAPPTTKSPTMRPPTTAPPTTNPPTMMPPTSRPPTTKPPTTAPPTTPEVSSGVEVTTAPPVSEPTTEPPVAGTSTMSPTASPTTMEPTGSPSSAPSAAPSTLEPTATPSSRPSPPPGAPTIAPTLSPKPSSSPSAAPSSHPSASPTRPIPPLQRLQAEGIVMRLSEFEPLDVVAQSIWVDVTAAHIRKEIVDQMEEMLPDEMSKVGVSIDLTEQLPPYEGRRLRRLQVDEQELTFNAVISIESRIDEHDVNSYILGAFDTKKEEDEYINSLMATMDEAFENLVSVSVAPAKTITELNYPPAGDDSPGRTDIATIGIIVGLVVVGIAGFGLAGYVLYSRRRRGTKKTPTSSLDEDPNDYHYGDEIDIGTRDEVSTLGDPIPPGMRNEFLGEDAAFSATTDSLTADYDFQKAYRNGQPSVVDSHTGSDPSSFLAKDDITLEAEYQNEAQTRFEVEAPPGLLGLVLETSEDGVPVVHAIKESSCLAGQVQVGDRLVCVDDEDVTSMLASSVSRLIASKKDHPVRRFAFTRPVEK